MKEGENTKPVKDVIHRTLTLVGWSTADHLRTELISEVLQQVLADRRPKKCLVHYSDQDVQYDSDDYQEFLQKNGCPTNMSRRGNCYDNVNKESFFGTLKTELSYHD